MTDRYQTFAASGPGRFVINKLGLPNPATLRRYQPGQPALDGPALVGAAPGGRLSAPAIEVLRAAEISVLDSAAAEERYGALVFDASGITSPDELGELREFFQPVIRSLGPCGRVLVLGSPPESGATAEESIAQRALEGFTRSVGKELRRGGTAQLVYVAPGAEGNMASTLRFLLSAKSAFVAGQVIRIGAGNAVEPSDWARPLGGKVAVVTGASQGIGAAMARVLGRDGAQVVALDIPAQGAGLVKVANEVGGSTLQLDITDPAAPARLREYLTERYGGVDILVHNAGITKDKTLAKMSADRWDAVLGVNLRSQLAINAELLTESVLRDNGRIIGVSSIAGIAGNFGQTNYGTSKAGVIGMVRTAAPVLAERGGTINAVAPGFIETRMTAKIPVLTREVGRRLSSLAQGGLPVDVAEAVAWYANPASAGVNGNIVRVCGQAFLGA
ncbi:3-oxoacyl-[acyl-carrier protein] reductase [Tamaricihabitans halophyticus]|uniref:3-oxoacyl-[acyl-carrier protein] reductase n=1 Tax=Tamaricihabitans halophyticus TaxID=1262583 RepID=A0A4R2R657_9PSEU|nr:3-oxoacyl-ACP reductase [Tamaricihabitans halophyticus]TCP57329.1 3-oxoacyl-[acyl-carrier protein] reductase [Tamaricihabitans halophyticus]